MLVSTVILGEVEEVRGIINREFAGCLDFARYNRSAVTNRYRHDALLCVHQVGHAPPRLSLTQAAPELAVRSSGLLSPAQPLPSFDRFYRRVFASYLLQRL